MVHAAGLKDAVFEAKSEYVDSMASWSDPLYRDIASKLPSGTKPSDLITSLSITATKRHKASAGKSADLDDQAKELIAIGAAVACNCHPCVRFHVGKAATLGLDTNCIQQAVDVGKRVRKGAAAEMDKLLIDNNT